MCKFLSFRKWVKVIIIFLYFLVSLQLRNESDFKLKQLRRFDILDRFP